ncbi:MAG: rRNA pseudouridine synthase [candidate division Zixibacteria bacterium]|nr:rRNA pseudouridine synthase [candidate division Zixibacteria bacterium]
MRLNKFLSRCGVVSRRGADKLIAKGRVTVNDKPVAKTGVIINEREDVVRVDGKVCVIPTNYLYIVLNKPSGYLVTLDDQFGRRTIEDLIKDVPRRVYPIGRLDYDTEGVLLLTDDGDFAFRLAHPRYGIRKHYTVRVKGQFQSADIRRFKEGITLEDGYVAHGRARLTKATENHSILTLELAEGRKREIKRMCKIIGYPVQSIRRIRFGNITSSDLPRGKWRYLTDHEVAYLKRQVGPA